MAAWPRRAPDSGSASSGQPALRAKAAAACPSPVSRSWRPATTTPRRRLPNRVAQSASCASARSRPRCPVGWSTLGALARAEASQERDAIRASLPGRRHLLAHQRLAQREVEVHHARASFQRGPVGAAGERAHPAQPLRRGLVRAHLEEPLRASPKSLSWSIACPAPTSRSSAGGRRSDEQRHPRLVRLDRPRAAAPRRRCPMCRRPPPAGRRPWQAPGRRSRRSARPRGSEQRRRSSRASASTSGAQREPGEVQAARIPQRASSSTNAPSSDRYRSMGTGQSISSRFGQLIGWSCWRVTVAESAKSSCCTASAAPAVPGTAWSRIWPRTLSAASRSTCPGTASKPARCDRSASRAACGTCSARSRALRARAAIRWAGASRCTWRWPRPSGSSGLVLISRDRRHRGRRASGTQREPTAVWPTSSTGPARGVHRALARPAAVRRATRPRSTRLARADQLRNRPDGSGRRAARHRHGRDASRCGTRLAELQHAGDRARRRARREVPCASGERWSRCCPTARLQVGARRS